MQETENTSRPRVFFSKGRKGCDQSSEGVFGLKTQKEYRFLHKAFLDKVVLCSGIR